MCMQVTLSKSSTLLFRQQTLWLKSLQGRIDYCRPKPIILWSKLPSSKWQSRKSHQGRHHWRTHIITPCHAQMYISHTHRAMYSRNLIITLTPDTFFNRIWTRRKYPKYTTTWYLQHLPNVLVCRNQNWSQNQSLPHVRVTSICVKIKSTTTEITQ